MTLTEKIQALLSGKQLSTKYADTVVAIGSLTEESTEEDVQKAVDTFKTIFEAGLKSENDRTLGQATQKAVDNWREKHGLDENGKPINSDPKKPEPGKPVEEKKSDDMNPALKAILDRLEGLSKTVETITKESKTKSIFEQGRNLLVDRKKIPSNAVDVFAKRLNADSEKSIEDQIEELENEYTSIYGASIEERVAGGTYRPRLQKPMESDDYQRIMDSNKVNSDDAVGVQKVEFPK